MAAAETARLIASLELQDKNFTRGLSNVERGIGRVDKKLGAFSGFLNRNVGRALDSLASRGVDALAGTIEQASSLQEQITKSQAVFGAASKDIITFSEGTAATLGLSQTAALEAAGAYGNMFKTIGLTEKTSGDMSKRLVELAADMASFNDVDPSEVLLKLRSGLSGEAEPLRTLGVLLSEARVKEEAYASGIAKKGKKLTEAQKVQARYNLILKDTAVQQGDVEKTGGNLAGQQRKLNALMADAGATIGTQLLPVVTELTGAFVDLLKDPGTQAGLKAFATDLGKGAKSLVSALKTVDWKGFAGALGTAAGFAKDLVTAFLGLPSWLQAAVITGWGLNKVTGGLVGDLASGLIKGVLGINAGVVNVNAGVVNGAGGLAGAAGAAGGKGGILGRLGGLKGIIASGVAVGLAVEAVNLWQDTNARSSEQAQTAKDNLSAMIANGAKTEDLKTSLLAVQNGIKDITSNPLLTLVQGDALDKLREMEATLKAQLAGTKDPGKQTPVVTHAGVRGGAPGKAASDPKVAGDAAGAAVSAKLLPTVKTITGALRTVRGTVATSGRETKSAISTMTDQQKANAAAQIAATTAASLLETFHAATQALKTAGTTTAVNQNATATRNVAPPIVGSLVSGFAGLRSTIWAARPVIQSTNVVNNYTTKQRTGTTSGSRNTAPLSTHRG